jgi:hypothetical protein
MSFGTGARSRSLNRLVMRIRFAAFRREILPLTGVASAIVKIVLVMLGSLGWQQNGFKSN